MKKLLLIAAAAALLCGCQAIQGTIGGDATKDAMKASQVAITTYADIYQPAVIFYGHLPACPDAIICKDANTLQNLKAVDLAATTSIIAAQEVLEGKAKDTGQITAAVLAIAQAEQTIAASGALVKH